ncbi:T9SS type A sorting domain-containing protein [Dyadobacter chenwenxiniae]|uniref:T9SS type A sorting domain-containing protein n=1 Tax=Dyadobacter chenwenxiniae TaxID=2906456 RepID=UPI002108518C|nr:T9SS type A sorting domain-containing protein [Dyadobacter chenwenxiniae]
MTNGNYVVQSEYWDNGSIVDAGAATWGSGLTGVTGIVSVSNSLVGTAEADNVGIVTALTNGNYVVSTTHWANGAAKFAGAVTWADGTKGITGTISISNSLVGSKPNDGVGFGYVCALANGNYANGETGMTGTVSASNSLIGSTNEDGVGKHIIGLTNGNYVVSSPNWSNGITPGVGAATFANGATALVGVISKSNSLIGYRMYDHVGKSAIPLKNGNYVICSPYWTNGPAREAGAVTLGNGTTGSVGFVSPFNSLVGSTEGDLVGWDVTALSDGNYVVASRTWRSLPKNHIGAVTWGDGNKNLKGPVSASNSLVGSSEFRYVGYVKPFENGNYYIEDNFWYNYNINAYAGAMTPMPGKTPLSGVVKSCNSILGTKPRSGIALNVTWNTVYHYSLVGYGEGNLYVIVNEDPVTDNNLAGDYSEATKTMYYAPATFRTDCGEIGMVVPSDESTAVTGPVKMKVYVALTAPSTDQPYVRRYYDITPEANAGTATGQVTLFIAQSDFDDFNQNIGDAPALPSGPTDIDGIQNIRITQIHGTSQTGYPNSYTGWTGSDPRVVLINPKDQDIVWNDNAKRWELSFAVEGFSGFFVHSNVNEQALPVHLASFTAVKSEGNALLKWKTTSEINASYFDIERSVDGKNFVKAGTVKATGNEDYTHSYSFVDTAFASLGQLAYYRLRAVDTDGSYAYSAIQRLRAEDKPVSTYVYPNPVRAGSSVTISTVGVPRNIQIVDLAGRSIGAAIIQRSDTGFVLSKLPQGVHLVKFDTDHGPEVRKLVVE